MREKYSSMGLAEQSLVSAWKLLISLLYYIIHSLWIFIFSFAITDYNDEYQKHKRVHHKH